MVWVLLLSLIHIFLPIDQIRPSPFQARREFSEQELAALAQSIRENGLLQPISVRKDVYKRQDLAPENEIDCLPQAMVQDTALLDFINEVQMYYTCLLYTSRCV